MTHQKLDADLVNSLPSSRPARLLAPILPDILRRVEAGVSHESILAALKAQGIDVPLNTFKSILYRYRQKIRAGGSPATLPSEGSLHTHPASPAPPVAHEDERPLTQTERLRRAMDPALRDAFAAPFFAQRPSLLGPAPTRTAKVSNELQLKPDLED